MKNRKMSKKKLISLFTGAALVGAVAVGGTLAYFTDKDEAKNVIATGNVDVELTDTFKEATSVVPNQKFDGLISVENVGVNDAFIRLSITPTNDSQLVLKDIQETFQTTAKTSESFATKEEAEARVAELKEQGIDAQIVEESASVEKSLQRRAFDGGKYKYIYVVEEMNGENVWVEKKLKPNTKWADYEWDGVMYESYYSSRESFNGKAVLEDEATYVLEDDGFWYRYYTEVTDTYDVAYTTSDLEAGFNETDWTLGEDGYYYYKDVFEAGETSTFVSGLHIPAAWGNAYANKTMEFDVVVEAIQADFLEDANGNEITNAQDAFNLGVEIEKYPAE